MSRRFPLRFRPLFTDELGFIQASIYVFTPLWGPFGRADLPSLYANNKTDAVVIALPSALQNELLGKILSGITSAGAFAAFMSTFSGLLVSMSGALAHDVYGKILRPQSTTQQRLTAFKIAAVVFGFVSMGLGLLVETFDITLMVGWAFAIAAASYFPLLLLGSWWRGLTKYGTAAGMLTGGMLSLGAIIVLGKKVLTMDVSPLPKALLEQPAIWGVPLALIVMFVVSKATANTVPRDVNLKMLLWISGGIMEVRRETPCPHSRRQKRQKSRKSRKSPSRTPPAV